MTVEARDWYSNKDLFEMIQSFQLQVSSLTKEMEKTTTLISDYNGLRETINDVDKRVGKIEQSITSEKDNDKIERQTKRDYLGWFIAGLMTIIAFLSYIRG